MGLVPDPAAVAAFWTWEGWDALVALGTLTLAAATFVLVVVTRQSVDTATRQIEVERKRAEAAQWPRVFPAPVEKWTFQPGPSPAAAIFPVTNGGPGVALNVFANFDFTGQDGPTVSTGTTSIAPGDSAELPIDWPHSPVMEWRSVRGRLQYEDVTGGRWITHFGVATHGPQRRRRVWVQETELAVRADGKILAPPESLAPAAWYSR